MVTGIGTVVAAGFAALAAGVFWNQLKAMQDQLTAQEADFRIDQRPILALTTDKPNGHEDGPQYDTPNKTLFWNYTVKNYGKGPAVTTKTCGYMSILGGNLIADNKGAGLKGGQLVPTQTFWGTVRYSAPVEPDVATTVEGGNGGIAVKIVIIYKDAYGTKFVSSNCLARNANGSVNWTDCTIPPISNIPIDTNKCETETREPPSEPLA